MRKPSHSWNSFVVADHGVMTILEPTVIGRTARVSTMRPVLSTSTSTDVPVGSDFSEIAERVRTDGCQLQRGIVLDHGRTIA